MSAFRPRGGYSRTVSVFIYEFTSWFSERAAADSLPAKPGCCVYHHEIVARSAYRGGCFQRLHDGVDSIRADFPAHLLTANGREPIVEAGVDARGGNLVGIGAKIRPAMGDARRGRTGHSHLGDVGRAQHRFDGARDRRADDAMGTWVLGVHWCVVDRLPR